MLSSEKPALGQTSGAVIDRLPVERQAFGKLGQRSRACRQGLEEPCLRLPMAFVPFLVRQGSRLRRGKGLGVWFWPGDVDRRRDGQRSEARRRWSRESDQRESLGVVLERDALGPEHTHCFDGSHVGILARNSASRRFSSCCAKTRALASSSVVAPRWR